MATAKQRVKVRDRGLREIVQKIKAGDGVRVLVGIQGSQATTSHGGLTNVGLGAVHEFGARFMHPGGTAFTFGAGGTVIFVSNESAGGLPRTAPHMIEIPERSFIRATFDRHFKKYTRFIGNSLGQGNDVRRTLALAGELHKADIVRAIDSGIAPPNKPATIARKGSSKPLIASGQLKQSITVKVEDS